MNIILATRNPSKTQQVQTLFADSEINVLTQSDVGVEAEAVEDGDSLEENAKKKAAFVHERMPGAWIMADDTGIFIHSLDGEPGIQAAYWGGSDLSTEDRLRYCLQRLDGQTDRSATFRTVVVVMAPSGETHTFIGEVEGELLSDPRVAPQPKMPYSPLFVPRGETRSWAEMTTEYENRLSHRGKAFTQVKAFLETAAV